MSDFSPQSDCERPDPREEFISGVKEDCDSITLITNVGEPVHVRSDMIADSSLLEPVETPLSSGKMNCFSMSEALLSVYPLGMVLLT